MTRVGTYKDVERNLKQLRQFDLVEFETTKEHVVAKMGETDVFKAMKKGQDQWICWYNPDVFKD